MYKKVYKNFLKRIHLFENIKVIYSNEKELQNSIFVTLDIHNQKLYTFNKSPLKNMESYKRVCIPLIVTDTKKSHSKLLVIEFPKVYIFDPYGYDNFFENTVEEFFEILSYKFNLSNYTLMTEKESNDICSFQYFEEEEKKLEEDYDFEKCVLWVFWFIEMMDANPSFTYKNLLNYLYDETKYSSYRKIIYEYYEGLSK